MNENETRPCNPTLPVELVGEAQKIKGDAIGSTLYSQCWVLKVLMKLTQLSGGEALGEELEGELCLLWDMTVEEDVVWFLVRNDVLDIIAFILRKDQEPRLMEILVGMLANLCVVEGACRRAVRSPAVRELAARTLFCTDSLTLVQLMRLYTTCLQRLRADAGQDEHRESSVNGDSGRDCSDAQVGDRSDGAEADEEPCGGDEQFLEMLVSSDSCRKQITFLLQSSTNGALLSSMLHMLDELYLTAAECKTAVPSMYSAEMIAAIVEALKELKAGVPVHGDDETARKAVFQALSIISNFVDSEQGVTALCETGDALASYVCARVDPGRLCGRLSLDSAQFVTRCLNVFGCAFALLACRADLAGWAVSLLGHLAGETPTAHTLPR
ncbi:protein saal1 isoform X2 [Bacillus rossius redtenbacheri]|uniref:protein saal1 isoform X2 n=1 Tax=Bacillus rossius redtenbacheri TaxID=93214 RepID=UPI002FDD4A38